CLPKRLQIYNPFRSPQIKNEKLSPFSNRSSRTLNEHGSYTAFPYTAYAVSGCKPTTFPQFNNTFFALFLKEF
ncbi:hypothetical protein OO009_08490, partial [Flavobacteriaceae bacterium KMM 6897]|nr:hypothetical protein [Flavobacteriaceae bacterium KMM 6897]